MEEKKLGFSQISEIHSLHAKRIFRTFLVVSQIQLQSKESKSFSPPTSSEQLPSCAPWSYRFS
jgi:site-specific recombinase XerC